jgi:polysaccharide biosynthesis transport protein
VYATPVPPDDHATLELRDYLRVIRRRKWIMAVTMLVCIGAALTMALLAEPIYGSSAKVLLERRFVETLFDPTLQQQQQSSVGDAATQRGNEIQVMSSPRVFKVVEKKLGRPPEPVNFVSLEGTDVVEIGSESANAKRASATANAFATTYIKVRKDLAVSELLEAGTQIQAEIDKLDKQIADLDASLLASPPQREDNGEPLPPDEREVSKTRLQGQRLSYVQQLDKIQTGAVVEQQGGAKILAKAVPSTTPVNRDPVRNGLAGLAIGLVLGVALAFLREYLDDTIKSKEDLEAASGLTAVGLIPALPDWKNRDTTQLVAMAQPRSPAAEAYRTVRTAVEFLSLDEPIGSLQVTSALAGEGKTTTLANLATTFARAGQRVIVLCCDMRRPRIHEFFGLTNRVGFTSVLLGDVPIGDAIQRVPGELPIGLVASGPRPPNPAELLASQRAVGIVESLDKRCDLLLIDSPPVLPVTDALVIAGLVDGVLLVGNSGSTTKRSVRRAVELLHQVHAPLIGAILNGVASKSEYSYVYGDDRYYQQEEQVAANGRNGRNGRKTRARPPERARVTR